MLVYASVFCHVNLSLSLLLSIPLSLFLSDDCASLLLACLYCRFSELLRLVPETCGRCLVRCCPSCRYYDAAKEPMQNSDYCNCNMSCDCGLLDSCQETSELIELAMEISEVCYR